MCTSVTPASRTIRDTLTAFSALLAGKAVDSPRLSAELLLAHVLRTDRLQLLVRRGHMLTEKEYAQAEKLILRRAAGEPVAYLTGSREFYGREFAVSTDTLIPRPDTELLIDTLKKEYPPHAALRFADLGTGSGCIAVSVAAEMPSAHGTAVDISSGALHTARENAARHRVADRVAFVQADFTSPLFRPASFDVVLSNPPYVSATEYETLSPEVRCHEPQRALVPDTPASTGLEHAAALLPLAFGWLKPGGLFLMEFGWKQGPDIMAMVKAQHGQWTVAVILQDLAGRDRALYARRCD
jgi:release factor glutamine methyltransferase